MWRMPDPLGSFDFVWPFYIAVLLGYLTGSIPFGLILTRLTGAGDIRKIGSGNIGATNVLRTGRKGLAFWTLILDGGKGALVISFASIYGTDMAILAGGGAILGHCFPVWLKFKGGKGVATGFGIIICQMPLVSLLCISIWILTIISFRYSSVAAIFAFSASPALAFYFIDQQHAEFAGFLAILVVFRHHQNIRRLIKGDEQKVSFSRGKHNSPT